MGEGIIPCHHYNNTCGATEWELNGFLPPIPLYPASVIPFDVCYNYREKIANGEIKHEDYVPIKFGAILEARATYKRVGNKLKKDEEERKKLEEKLGKANKIISDLVELNTKLLKELST